MAIEIITDGELLRHHGARRDILLDILRSRGYSLQKVFQVDRDIPNRRWVINVQDKDEVPHDANVLMYL